MDTKEILDRIIAWQECDYVHPLTCGYDSSHPPLVGDVTQDGQVMLVCVACWYTQETLPPLPSRESLIEHTKRMREVFGDAPTDS